MSEGTRVVNTAAEITALRGKVQELEKQIDFLLALGKLAGTNDTQLAKAMNIMLDRLRTVEAQGKAHNAQLDALALISRSSRPEPTLQTGPVTPYNPAALLPSAVSPFTLRNESSNFIAIDGKKIPPGGELDIPI